MADLRNSGGIDASGHEDPASKWESNVLAIFRACGMHPEDIDGYLHSAFHELDEMGVDPAPEHAGVAIDVMYDNGPCPATTCDVSEEPEEIFDALDAVLAYNGMTQALEASRAMRARALDGDIGTASPLDLARELVDATTGKDGRRVLLLTTDIDPDKFAFTAVEDVEWRDFCQYLPAITAGSWVIDHGGPQQFAETLQTRPGLGGDAASGRQWISARRGKVTSTPRAGSAVDALTGPCAVSTSRAVAAPTSTHASSPGPAAPSPAPRRNPVLAFHAEHPVISATIIMLVILIVGMGLTVAHYLHLIK